MTTITPRGHQPSYRHSIVSTWDDARQAGKEYATCHHCGTGYARIHSDDVPVDICPVADAPTAATIEEAYAENDMRATVERDITRDLRGITVAELARYVDACQWMHQDSPYARTYITRLQAIYRERDALALAEQHGQGLALAKLAEHAEACQWMRRDAYLPNRAYLARVEAILAERSAEAWMEEANRAERLHVVLYGTAPAPTRVDAEDRAQRIMDLIEGRIFEVMVMIDQEKDAAKRARLTERIDLLEAARYARS